MPPRPRAGAAGGDNTPVPAQLTRRHNIGRLRRNKERTGVLLRLLPVSLVKTSPELSAFYIMADDEEEDEEDARGGVQGERAA